MVFGVKGPKSVLSAAIANALAEYFEVDANRIESNLLSDAKIVLRHVLLRKQTTRLPRNSAGYPTVITVTGSVDEVAFTWAWSVGSRQRDDGSSGTSAAGWVKDAVLSITGLKFNAQLAHGTGEEELTISDSTATSSEENSFTAAVENNAAEIQNEGGINAYLRRQVEMIIDSLTLKVHDFELTVQMPPPLTHPSEDSEPVYPEGESIAIVIGGQTLEFLSFGRQKEISPDPKTPATSQPEGSGGGVLKQRITLGSFYSNITVLETSDDDTTEHKATHQLMEPFTYTAEATRTGQRFSGVATGLDVVGLPIDAGIEAAKDDVTTGGGNLVLHAGTVQIEAFTQLGVMLLAPPDPAGEGSPKTSVKEEAVEDRDPQVSTEDVEAKVSSFIFPISSVSLILQENMCMTVPKLIMTYRADGTVMGVEAEGFQLESLSSDCPEEMGAAVSVSGIKASMRPSMQLEVDVIETLYIPDIVRLTSPIRRPKVAYEGSTLSIYMDSIEATKLSNKAPVSSTSTSTETKSAARTDSSKQDEKGTTIYGVSSAECKHQFEEHSYKSPTYCNVCDGLLAGLWSQGLQCKMCRINIHRGKGSGGHDDCHAEALLTSCPGLISPEVISASKTSSTVRSAKGGDLSVSTKDSCKQDDDTTSAGARMTIPIPVNVSIRDVKLKSSLDGSLMQLKDFDFYINPDNTTNSTHVAFRLGEFKNELLHLCGANVYALLPNDRPDEIQAFNAAAESGKVTAGYSTQDWSEKFQRSEERRRTKAEVMKLPFATIAALKLTIAWRGKGVSFKDTKVTVKPFNGKYNTTSKDLVNFYAQACLKHVPGFVENAEVLGLNVLDSTAVTYGAWLGMGSLGAGGGVAAMAAVDGVKGAVSSGKKSRKVDDGEGWKPGDFVRGIIYATGEATREGAILRGKADGKGNVADFAVGMSAATGEYVGENKSRLGAAGGGGVGMVFGTMLGGPIGGIVGGIVGSAVTGKTIDTMESKAERSAKERLDKDRAESDPLALSTVTEETS